MRLPVNVLMVEASNHHGNLHMSQCMCCPHKAVPSPSTQQDQTLVKSFIVVSFLFHTLRLVELPWISENVYIVWAFRVSPPSNVTDVSFQLDIIFL